MIVSKDELIVSKDNIEKYECRPFLLFGYFIDDYKLYFKTKNPIYMTEKWRNNKIGLTVVINKYKSEFVYKENLSLNSCEQLAEKLKQTSDSIIINYRHISDS